MEVKIKNTTDKKQRAVVFGFNYTLHGGGLFNLQDPSFFNIKTDDGIEITYDGDGSKEHIESIYKKMCSDVINIKNIEYTSNNNKLSIGFFCLSIDANGKLVFDPIYPSFFLSPTQESIFPIIITDEYGVKIKGIDCNTSLLFILEPNEEIYLKINEKIVVKDSQKAKLNG